MIGLVLADSAKHTAHALTMLILTQRRLADLRGQGLKATTLKTLLATAVMGAVVWLIGEGLWRGEEMAFIGKLTTVVVAGGIGFVIYVVLVSLLGVEEVRTLRQTIWRWLRPVNSLTNDKV
jgi:peptidoglycan biosynthesis protein MviN/MurJ (putative lipid II flippase)